MQDIHQPVMVEEVIRYLGPKGGGIYVDGSLGLGGHAEKILERCGPAGRLLGFDLDDDALALAEKRLARFQDRVHLFHANFTEIKTTLTGLGIKQVNGLLLDLGLSSFQLDKSGRGFSFKGNEPLDMRMDTREPLTAADIINTATRDELADIFFYYGQDRQARRIASFITTERQKAKIATTEQLVAIVGRAVPRRYHPKNIHVATKVFQGLRMAVNRELENLVAVLTDASAFLKSGARLCVISFHSLEDRLVKQAFRENPGYVTITRKPVMPGADERRRNPRSRSAKLRVAAIKD